MLGPQGLRKPTHPAQIKSRTAGPQTVYAPIHLISTTLPAVRRRTKSTQLSSYLREAAWIDRCCQEGGPGRLGLSALPGHSSTLPSFVSSCLVPSAPPVPGPFRVCQGASWASLGGSPGCLGEPEAARRAPGKLPRPPGEPKGGPREAAGRSQRGSGGPPEGPRELQEAVESGKHRILRGCFISRLRKPS